MLGLRTATAVALAGLTVFAAPAGAAMTAHGSIGQAYVVGAKKSAQLQLLDAHRKVVASGKADRFGSKIWIDQKPATGYRVKSGTTTSKPFAVLAAGDNPPPSFYKKIKLKQGLNYVTMRDGVELAMTVRLPPGKTLADGPFPTLIEYSGYQTAAPHDLISSVVSSLTGAPGTSDPLAPATSTVVGSVVGPLLNFAVVSVQMRGSGCSGGAFGLFDLPTTYDGYDAVESTASQSWVKGGKVGLAGISFSGITQLFVAGTQPPHLAAIAPMSVTDDLYQGTSFPGGIFNKGFALTWVKERLSDAQPAPAGGQPWARELTREGDQHCIANQKLRLQTQDALKLINENPFRTPSLYDDRAPGAWIKRIKVPTFLVGQFQDEQTGGHFAESLGALAHNRNVWITLQNGVHVDSLGPDTTTRWAEFLDLYVANEVPSIPLGVLALSGELYKFLADAGAKPVLQSRFAGSGLTVAQAKAVFQKDPRVRLLMDNGGTDIGPGSIGSAWEIGLSSWPVEQAKATAWWLTGDGALSEAKPSGTAASYKPDPKARPKQTLPGDGAEDAWKAQPPYEWAPIASGKGLGFATAPLTKDVVIAGSSSLDLYLKSSAKDTDLQVTLSEIRPDGNETYVQNGWLRASHRKLDAKRSTATDPVPTHLPQDGAPLATGFNLVRVPIFPVAHAFRAGSRIRVTIEAPGGDRPRWEFDTIERGKTTNTIGFGDARPSMLVLPVLSGVDAKGTPLPAPTALRGEPNRKYVAASNGG